MAYCSENYSTDVVHGKNVTSKNKIAQSIVAIISSKDESSEALCTGSIIGKNSILTAAHCVDQDPANINIVFGIDIHKAKPEFIRAANQFVIHPNWNRHLRSGEADLAIIHFEGDLPDGYMPVDLADQGLELKKGQTVFMAGFGVTDGETKAGAGKLHQMTTEILDFHSATEIVTDGQQSSVCFGDSGGPAFIEVGNVFIQWGVASSVASEACNDSSVHTEVMKYLSWINTSVEKFDNNF
jgi:secreted trypsin-like serine protease